MSSGSNTPMKDDLKGGPLLQMNTAKLGPVPIGWMFSPHGGYTGVVRYTVVTIGMLATSLVMLLAVGPMQSLRGVPGPTVEMAINPMMAGLVLLVLMLASLLVACLVGRLINALVGLFVLGWGIMVFDMQCGTIEDLVFANGSLLPLVMEGLVWSVVVLFMAGIVFWASGPLPDYPEEDPRNAVRLSEIFSADALKSALAGLLMLVAVWFLLWNDLKGQAIGVVMVGGLATGACGRLLSPKVQPILLFAAPMIAGTLGYAVGMTMQTKPLEEMFLQGNLPALIHPMPLDYVVGSLCGVAMGIGWGRAPSA